MTLLTKDDFSLYTTSELETIIKLIQVEIQRRKKVKGKKVTKWEKHYNC